jgi:hypothetical protein
MSMVVLYLCHLRSKGAAQECRRICDAVRPAADVWLLYHSNGKSAPLDVSGTRVYPFTDESLSALSYVRFASTIVPGSCHFPVLQFFRDHPDYDYYWLIEYDVRFSGDWNELFGSFANHHVDFLTSHLRDYADEPKWVFWQPLSHPHKQIPLADRLRSFSPIYRLSNAALRYLDQVQQEGWRGHMETLVPTLLFQGGFRLGDFGGTGKFVLPEHENKFYVDSPPDETGALRQGTMRWRPAFSRLRPKLSRITWERNKLFHPVKAGAPNQQPPIGIFDAMQHRFGRIQRAARRLLQGRG